MATTASFGGFEQYKTGHALADGYDGQGSQSPIIFTLPPDIVYRLWFRPLEWLGIYELLHLEKGKEGPGLAGGIYPLADGHDGNGTQKPIDISHYKRPPPVRSSQEAEH